VIKKIAGIFLQPPKKVLTYVIFFFTPPLGKGARRTRGRRKKILNRDPRESVGQRLKTDQGRIYLFDILCVMFLFLNYCPHRELRPKTTPLTEKNAAFLGVFLAFFSLIFLSRFWAFRNKGRKKNTFFSKRAHRAHHKSPPPPLPRPLGCFARFCFIAFLVFGLWAFRHRGNLETR
jgi:hypothetical protein